MSNKSGEVQSKLLNEEHLQFLTIVGEGDDFFEGLVLSFEGNSSKLMASLEAALENQDSKETEVIAHHLRGASGSIGAQRLVELCGALEDLVREGENIGKAQKALAEIQKICAESLVHLKKNWLGKK